MASITTLTEEQDKELRDFRIIGKFETFADMVHRVFSSIAEVEYSYGAKEIEVFRERKKTAQMFIDQKIVPSTPILTNAGLDGRPLSACSVPPVKKKMNHSELEQMVNHYHKRGMGTGFNFDDSDDPIKDLLFLNQLAINEFERDQMDRPVGNMGILSIGHPNVLEFAGIKSKMKKDEWKFNISINLDTDFMDAVRMKGKYQLQNGATVDAKYLLNQIVGYAHDCGDPGLLFLDRFEEFNITPHIGKYVSLAPCGEIPMASGETCQFTYVNVGKFVENRTIDFEGLKQTVTDTVRFLDNCLDISIANIGNERSAYVNSQKRKIGIGICGFQDLLWELGLAYDSKEAIQTAEDLMSLINYSSKEASINLAIERGAFPAYTDPETRRELILNRYKGKDTRTVKSTDWERLEEEMEKYGIRHVSTTALPPTGRSSIIIGASPSIEPMFRIDYQIENRVFSQLEDIGYVLSPFERNTVHRTGSLKDTKLPKDVKAIYRTCLGISPTAHILMVAAFQRFTDDSISKTVNLPNNVSPSDIRDTYLLAYDQGLKGITVYRDGCKIQPKALRN